MLLFYTLVFLCICFLQVDSVQITSVKPTEGGIYGGTRITITGAGFSESTGGGGNEVYISIASSPRCDVLTYLSSYDQIVCVTRAPSTQLTRRLDHHFFSDYMLLPLVLNRHTDGKVHVIVDGVYQAEGPTFRYSIPRTPYLKALSPNKKVRGTF